MSVRKRTWKNANGEHGERERGGPMFVPISVPTGQNRP